VLDAADVAVSIYSTSLLEGAALGTPAVIFNPTSLPPFEPDLAACGAAERADDAQVALAAIARILSDDDHRERMRAATATAREHFFAGGDSADAALRTAEEIER
jgi:glycosyltransferase involved in cell wall biosynthesis